MDMSMLPPGVPLSQIPLAVNPDGSPPNFVNPESLAPQVATVGIVFGILATIFVGIKVFHYATSPRGLGIDDGLQIIALAIAHAYVGLAISFKEGQRHSWDVPLSLLDETYSKKTTVTGFIVGPGMGLAKVAILLMQLRVFAPKKWFRVLSYAGIVFILIVHWSNVPVYGALCVPRGNESWGLPVMLRCAEASKHTVIVGALSTAFDVFQFVLPLPIIAGLHLDFRRKIGISLIFLAGILAVVSSAISLYYRVLLYKGDDIMWNGALVYIFVFIEYYIAIIVGCAPALVGFWNSYLSKTPVVGSLRSLLRRTRTGSSYQASDYPTGEVPSAKTIGSAESFPRSKASHESYELDRSIASAR